MTSVEIIALVIIVSLMCIFSKNKMAFFWTLIAFGAFFLIFES